jgi:putative ATPase
LIRGSDVNAALHYLARLIEAGDLPTIVRRLLVISFEDASIALIPEFDFGDKQSSMTA